MSLALARPRMLSRVSHEKSKWAIAAHVWRSSVRGAVILGVVSGVFVLASIKGYTVGYPTLEARIDLARSMQSFAPLLGPPRHAETVGGFTVWRTLVAMAIIGGVWGLRTGTGAFRGEEDAGRWEVLLAGPTSKRWAATQTLIGLGGALAAMYVVTAVLTIVAGRLPGARIDVGAALVFSLATIAGAAMFLAIGALTSQLGASRGQAATIASAILGASYVVRMVADSSTRLGWLRWLSPIGWVQETRPVRDVQPWAFVPIVALVVITAWLTVTLAGRRDLYGSVLREREGRSGDARWLAGPLSLSLRLSWPTALAWIGGVAGVAALAGSLSRSMATILADSPTITAALGRLGVRRASEGFMGLMFLWVAVLIAVIAANQVAAMRDEEASGRLENLLVRPVHRLTWLAGRLGLAAALLVLAGLAAGAFTWLGAASQHVGISLPKLLAAGINASVPGLCVLGLGTLVFGVWPRLSVSASYAVVVWSFLVNLLGALLKDLDWVRDSSVFAHMALAPAANPDWGDAAAVLLVGIAAAGIGAAVFARRDLQYV